MSALWIAIESKALREAINLRRNDAAFRNTKYAGVAASLDCQGLGHDLYILLIIILISRTATRHLITPRTADPTASLAWWGE